MDPVSSRALYRRVEGGSVGGDNILRTKGGAIMEGHPLAQGGGYGQPVRTHRGNGGSKGWFDPIGGVMGDQPVIDMGKALGRPPLKGVEGFGVFMAQAKGDMTALRDPALAQGWCGDLVRSSGRGGGWAASWRCGR